AVTRDGEVFAAGWVVGGSAGAPSRLEVQAALEETDAALEELVHHAERLRFALASAQADRERREAEVQASLTQLHDSDAKLAAVAERLAQLGAVSRAAHAEAERLAAAREQAEVERARWAAEVADLQARFDAVQAEPEQGPPDAAARELAAADAVSARAREVDARLAVRTAEERISALQQRARALESAAGAERERRSAASRAAARRAREALVARAVAQAAERAVVAVEASLARAAQARERAQTGRTIREGELLAVRAETRELTSRLELLTDAVHRDELARAEQRARMEAVAARALEEFGVEEASLLADYGPEVPVAVIDAETGELAQVAFDREAQEQRAKAAERALAVLGRVNPLALEEYEALQERQRFLAEQLADLRATRRDLLTVVREVDERVQSLFAAAFEDTARQFEGVFATLFPGGEGRLVLTEPDDLLTSGVEVEARPPGKKVKRLSLLSGGERSLTAIAVLVAIFRARPSPFYVLDEVEAALDDRNLERLLRLLSELRTTSQLIVVTHQKRTMEVADSLYGVTMRQDGISQVVSQRLREPEPV
ncbi:MAG: AAA family ATPase, partial [Mycobacteriales bacterium]